jgi:hypothetical protein
MVQAQRRADQQDFTRHWRPHQSGSSEVVCSIFRAIFQSIGKVPNGWAMSYEFEVQITWRKIKTIGQWWRSSPIILRQI